MSKVVAIVSGGMDSVTLAYKLAAGGHALHLLSFDYGQRHRKELDFARLCADRLSAQHDVIDLSELGLLLSGSALTDRSVAVPDGHYADETMKLTVVPNRNAIMLSVACGVAVAERAGFVAIGVHAGDHPIYPDCRPAFIDAFDAMVKVATDSPLSIYAPFIHLKKEEIVEIGVALGVPYEDTWSCYKGGALHCGKCGTCVERREAFELAGVHDPTDYE